MYEARQNKEKVSRRNDVADGGMVRQRVKIEKGNPNNIIQKSKGELYGGIVGGIVGTFIGGSTGTLIGGLGIGTAIGGSLGLATGSMTGIQIGRRIEHYKWKHTNAPFSVNDILYASMDKGKVGSIYFPTGRIRLTHPNGPTISNHDNPMRYTISNADYRANKVKRGTLIAQIQTLPSYSLAQIGGERLLESFHGKRIEHISRGGPVAFNYGLNQQQLNLIYHAAETNENRRLRIAMQSDPITARIPIQ
ncbi:hypothetical protein [Phocaeicola barnesiae]|uniref:hypothetical protein n=1 Tax=Phocaeicola barnesiae TaxID=376804 RepID=UPI00241C5235|nr:hypothetical protein [Phocaeicola barnesiae]